MRIYLQFIITLSWSVRSFQSALIGEKKKKLYIYLNQVIYIMSDVESGDERPTSRRTAGGKRFVVCLYCYLFWDRLRIFSELDYPFVY